MEVLSEYIPSELLDKVASKAIDREYHYGKFFFTHKGLGYTFYHGSCKIATVYDGKCIKKVTFLCTEDIQFLPYIDNNCDIFISRMSEKVFKKLLSYTTISRVDGAQSFNIQLYNNQLEAFSILSRRFGNLRVKQITLYYRLQSPQVIYLNRISCVYLCTMYGVYHNPAYFRGTNNEIFIIDVNGDLDVTEVANYQRMFPNAICMNFYGKNIVNENHILYNEETADLIRINDMDKLARFNRTKSAVKK